MAFNTLINDKDSFNGTITLEKSAGTLLTLLTAGTYNEKIVELTLNAKIASPSFKGGALNNKKASASFINITTSETDTSGIIVIPKASAERDAVLYNEKIEGWVSKENNDLALNPSATENWNGSNYYITGVTINTGKKFNINMPDGENIKTYSFELDENGNEKISGDINLIPENIAKNITILGVTGTYTGIMPPYANGINF